MKPRRLLGWLVVACIVFVVGLAAANVVDYVQFHRAVAGAILMGHVSPFTLTSRNGWTEVEAWRASIDCVN